MKNICCRLFVCCGLAFLAAHPLFAKQINLPKRPAEAMTGSKFANTILDLPLEQRERAAEREVLSGNVPDFWREFVPVRIAQDKDTIVYDVAPDYLAIGSDEDYLLMPLTPFTAQKIADALDCSLPTPKMVNQIYSNAVAKLEPSPIPPTSAMTTVPTFVKHNETVRMARKALVNAPLGVLTAGHKKDVVISNKLLNGTNKVAIYGWHKKNGLPIQPLFTGHSASWADYSHGIRLIAKPVMVNGAIESIEKIFADAELAKLLSDEGPLKQPRYVLTEFPKEKTTAATATKTSAKAAPQFPGEEVTDLKFDPQVRIQINAPAKTNLDARKKLLLIFYSLPNGNTIEQTAGKQLKPGDDWHFDIQHIAAQTRFLREKMSEQNIVVAYLENELKSWPAWRKKNGDTALPKVIELVKSRFSTFDTSVMLAGHSGGGSFIFGYLNTQEQIPKEIERIAFLDANYAYDTALHHDKIAAWLKNSDRHFLTVLAYHDNIALLDGKPFVTAAGGTWGKSHQMLGDFEKDLTFDKKTAGDLETDSALHGRMQFLLMENPEKKILHTVQVERNGFIHVVLAGTPLEENGYKYFGERAYSRFIGRD